MRERLSWSKLLLLLSGVRYGDCGAVCGCWGTGMLAIYCLNIGDGAIDCDSGIEGTAGT